MAGRSSVLLLPPVFRSMLTNSINSPFTGHNGYDAAEKGGNGTRLMPGTAPHSTAATTGPNTGYAATGPNTGMAATAPTTTAAGAPRTGVTAA